LQREVRDGERHLNGEGVARTALGKRKLAEKGQIRKQNQRRDGERERGEDETWCCRY
jgi:hypothetical protein